MSRVVIVTDSTAYLPQTYVDQYGIGVLPLTLTWEGKTYRDGVDIQPDEFYERMKTTTAMPTTSQLGVFEVEQAFTRILEEGNQALGLFISSGISGSFQSALMAKQNLDTDRIHVFDTRLVSMALSFQVLAAARAAAEGASLAECSEVARQAYDKIGVYFTVDSLTYLARGGRIGGAKRLLGSALNIKPILEIRDGKIEAAGSVISRRKAVDRMIEMVETGIGGRSPVRVSVFHAACPEEAIALAERLDRQFHPVENIPSFVSPVVGSHVGPGTISIAYMAG
ncbi:MAG TPA: DegV family protein [Anaerolineaceae bacterium]|nr:DegV family protein [Anaerolineaceae bacterium]HQL38140.1 DegV family protein [Anaerolineaceae bacterium]